jgi:hypothetical protein
MSWWRWRLALAEGDVGLARFRLAQGLRVTRALGGAPPPTGLETAARLAALAGDAATAMWLAGVLDAQPNVARLDIPELGLGVGETPAPWLGPARARLGAPAADAVLEACRAQDVAWRPPIDEHEV